MLLAGVEFADGNSRKHDRPTGEARDIRRAIRPARCLYGHALAERLGPRALKVVRDEMVRAGLSRTDVNKRVGRLVRAFKWAVGEELISPTSYQALKAVPGLRRGRTAAHESEPIRHVLDALVDAIRPFVARQDWAVIELQCPTGMRPGEVASTRTADVDTSGTIWAYRPAPHKTEYHGRPRVVFLGPRSSEDLRP